MLIEIENLFKLKKNKILAKKNVESSNQSHIFWTFLESENFNENFNDKLLLNIMFHEGDLAFEQYKSGDLFFGDYYLEKMNNVKAKLNKSYQNFACFEAPLLAYKKYKENAFLTSVDLLKKSIIALESLFDRSYSDSLYGKIEQITNIFKVNIKAENWQYIDSNIANFISDLSVNGADIYFFRKNEMDFYKSQNQSSIESIKSHFFENIFFVIINYPDQNHLFFDLIFKNYGFDIDKLKFDSVRRKYYVDDLKIFDTDLPPNIEKYLLKNYLSCANNSTDYKGLIDSYIAYID